MHKYMSAYNTDEQTSIKSPLTAVHHEASHLCCMCMPCNAHTS